MPEHAICILDHVLFATHNVVPLLHAACVASRHAFYLVIECHDIDVIPMTRAWICLLLAALYRDVLAWRTAYGLPSNDFRAFVSPLCSADIGLLPSLDTVYYIDAQSGAVRALNAQRVSMGLPTLRAERLTLPLVSTEPYLVRDCGEDEPATFASTVLVGGTFDHLHAGHLLLLSVAALYAEEHILCGVSGTWQQSGRYMHALAFAIPRHAPACTQGIRRVSRDMGDPF